MIEILVVVAIIAVLASMLMPALQKAREKSRQAVCMNNLRQIGIAFIMYLDDYNGEFPWQEENDINNANGIYYWFGLLNERYLHNRKVFRCPSDPDYEYTANHLSYGYNTHALGDGPTYMPVNTRLSQIKNLSEMILVADSDKLTNHNGGSGILNPK